MMIPPENLKWVWGAGIAVTLGLIALSTKETPDELIKKRLDRVGPQGRIRKIKTRDRDQAIRRTNDSSIAILNHIVHFLPNPDKLRRRIARAGKTLALGEYLLINILVVVTAMFIFNMLGWSRVIGTPLSFAIGFGFPHFVVGFMGNRRIKKFLAVFPEAIDTMTRGIRSGLPVTESINAVGRELPDPIGIEFHRMADGVRVGKTLESAMWEVNNRIDIPEFRFLIIAMAIQKETGGNLAETLGNLSDLIRRRRQLRMKIKAMSSEAIASAMIIGSLPFIMFILLFVVNPDYVMTLFQTFGGKILLGIAIGWMTTGWVVMIKMTKFEI